MIARCSGNENKSRLSGSAISELRYNMFVAETLVPSNQAKGFPAIYTMEMEV